MYKTACIFWTKALGYFLKVGLLHSLLHFRFQFCLEHLDIVDGLNDDLQLRQLAWLLEVLWQHSPQVLHVCGADVGGVKVKVSNLHTHGVGVMLM